VTLEGVNGGLGFCEKLCWARSTLGAMLPGWMGMYPQLAAMSSNSLLSNSARSSSDHLSPLIRTPPPGTIEEQKEKERAVVVRALREIAEKKAQEESDKADRPSEEKTEKKETDPDKIPRCHLHRKPNTKCKKCQAVIAFNSEEKKEKEDKAASSAAKTSAPSKPKERQSFQVSPMLKEQVVKCSYFRSLQEINSIDNLVHEVSEYADTLDVYNPGSRTDPSCFICQVLRLSQLPHIEDDMHLVVDNRQSDRCRCVGLLYLRFATAPSDLFEAFEEYLLDDMELRYTQDGQDHLTTIGEYAESLLVDEKYFETPMPRIPVKVRHYIEEKVAPMAQFRKRMEANKENITAENVYGLQVEVFLDGNWVNATAEEVLYNSPHRAKIRVALDGQGEEKETMKAHLGKVVIREVDKGGNVGREDRSRSPPRTRGGKDYDWSRHKGKSEERLVEELRQRLRDKAVCGPGRSYAKRPLSFDASMSSTALGNMSGGAGEHHQQDGQSSRRQREEQDEDDAEISRRVQQQEKDRRAQELHKVFQKYSASSSAGKSSSGSTDLPDVLRLG